MKFTGKITKILPIQRGTGKTSGKEWQKVEFVIEENAEQYPDSLCIAAFNDKVEELVDINVGDLVDVEYNGRCNEYNGRVYNSLNLYKIVKIEQQVAQQAPQPMPQPQQVHNETLFQGNDGLPF